MRTYTCTHRELLGSTAALLDEEELDYDETMEDLDLHPTGSLEEGEEINTRDDSGKEAGKPHNILLLYMSVVIYQ